MFPFTLKSFPTPGKETCLSSPTPGFRAQGLGKVDAQSLAARWAGGAKTTNTWIKAFDYDSSSLQIKFITDDWAPRLPGTRIPDLMLFTGCALFL